LPEAWLRVLRHLGPGELKDFLAPGEEARWRQAIETKIGRAKEQELLREVVESLLADVVAESRSIAADANPRRCLLLIEECQDGKLVFHVYWLTTKEKWEDASAAKGCRSA
jgi:hypothetical protein